MSTLEVDFDADVSWVLPSALEICTGEMQTDFTSCAAVFPNVTPYRQIAKQEYTSSPTPVTRDTSKLLRYFRNEHYRVVDEWMSKILAWADFTPEIDAFASKLNA